MLDAVQSVRGSREEAALSTNHEPDPPAPSLAAAAAAFEEELSRLQVQSAELLRAPITSDKTLVRAQKALHESSACQLRLAEKLKDVVTAIELARRTQEGCLQQMMQAAERVQTRARELTVFIERFAGLGERAHAIDEPVRAVAVRKAEGAADAELLHGLRDVLGRTEAIIREADGLAVDASASDWPDVAREASSLKQQMQAARNRLLLAEKSMGGPLS